MASSGKQMRSAPASVARRVQSAMAPALPSRSPTVRLIWPRATRTVMFDASVPSGESSPFPRGPRTATVLEQGQVPLQLVRGDVGLVVVPFFALVSDEKFEHVVAQRLPQQLGILGH